MERKRGYQKVTANWKRIVSRLLILAMVMTSIPMTEVQAAEISTVNQAESTETESAESPGSDSLEETATDIPEGTEADTPESTQADEPEGTEANTSENIETDTPESTQADVPEESETSTQESTEADTPETIIPESTEEDVPESTETDPIGDINTDAATTVVSPEVNGNEVTFRYASSTATNVYLVGTMNNWGSDETIQMTDEDGDDVFNCTITLSLGMYEYKFLVDGVWTKDPSNTDYSGDNNVVRVGVSPEINGKEVTFRYANSDISGVYLVGSMNGWNNSATPMEKKDKVFTYTTTLSPGSYGYKFYSSEIADNGGWITDPLNTNYDSDGNSAFIISGLEDPSATGTKGTEITLPSTLNYVSESGVSSTLDVTYTVKNAEEESYVTINGNKVTVSTSYAGDTLELTATASNGVTSTATLYLYDKEYKYTIYVRSTSKSKMSADASALWIWDEAGETATEAAEYYFNEELVTLDDGNEWLKAEVTLICAKKIGIIFKEKGDWTWQTDDLFFENTAATDRELYIIEGHSTVYTSLEEIPTESLQRCVIIEYTREDNDYTDANVYSWDTGYGELTYDFEEQNGKYVAKIPVAESSDDKKIGFIIKQGAGWDYKDGGDNFVTFPADQMVVKVRFADGKITKVFPYNCGYEADRANNKVTFYYRDDSLFAAGNLASLEEKKVQLVMKTSTGNTDAATYTMKYDADTERFYTDEMELADNTDYYYYYLVGDTKVLDAYNSKSITVGEEEYSLLRNKDYKLNLTATVKNAKMDYNDNNLLSISWVAKDGDDLEGFTPETIYADLSQLGLSSETPIDPELLELTIACQDDIAAGTKKIPVTLIDDCENTYTATATVTVTERVKKENIDKKLGDFDWDEAVIYFAVTDRFFDGNTSNNTATEGYDASDATGQGRYHGGDFAGLTQKIDYLYDLGINTIWITPIVDNIDQNVRNEADGVEYYSYHGYWAEDFTKLNSHLGTEAEFKALLDAAHAKGMKVMVDVVINHAGYDTTDTFNTILKDKDGNYINMVRGAEDTISGDEKKDSLSGLPDFLTENEEVRNQLIEWQTSWMEKYDIDYYRVDTVKHVDNTTWSAFKNALTESNPDFKLIGEYYDAGASNDFEQLNTGRMDSLLDFEFKYYAKDFAIGNLSSVEASLAKRDETIGNTATLGSFLSSHDENGLLYTFKQTKEEWWAEAMMKVAATLQITAKGQPVIYYGEEIGLSGENNYPYYDNRYDFDWAAVEQQAKDENSFYNHYKTLLNIRRDYSEVFAKGGRSVVIGSDAEGYEVIRRSYEGTNIYVGMNVFGDDKEAKFYVSGAAGSTYTDLYNNKTYTVAADGSLTVTIPNATKGGTAILVLSDGENEEIKDTNTVTVKLHYYRPDGDYTDWNAWMWMDGKGGAQYEFEEENGEMVATISVEGRAVSSIYYRIRKGDWNDKDVDKDQIIDISNVVSGTVHYYVISGVEGGKRVLGADAIIGSKILTATYDNTTNKVTIVTSLPVEGSAATAFEIECTDGTEIGISGVNKDGCTYTLTLEKDLSAMSEILKSYLVIYDGYEYNLSMPNIYSSAEFEDKYTYDGDDLGAVWSEESTTFKVWAPTADKVQLALYESGTAETEDLIKKVDMTKGEQGVWSAVESGDLNGTYYTYLVTVNGKTTEACDPYAKTTGVNGLRAMVLDMDSTDPEGWDEDVSPNKGMTYTDAVIYELHVRDLSIDDSSGVSEEYQGKFLGLTETDTTTKNGTPTALNHMIDLGVTHVHLLPVYDYASVDETRLDEEQFNWGYDPLNYNTPEGSYSTDPYNGEVRVNEMKQMVKTLHDNNISVIMDVVYNHVYDADSYCFNQIVPKYFSRTNEDGSYSNGSGCGNDTASERAMVKKYIVDSVMYWKEEYHIDGFRFDLVGLLDTETMNAVIDEVHEKYPDVIFYGEGWTLNTAVSKDGYTMATQANAKKTPELAYFSDTIRDLLAGNNGNGTGFVSGLTGVEEGLSQCFTATSWWIPEPTQTVNYASCHDNYTLMDKLNVTRPDASEADRIKMNNLAAAIYMTSQGIPLIHAGEEFLRTKVDENGEVIHNSYNASDYVNKLRWYNLDDEKYADVSEYYKGLIEFRKNHKALRLTTKEEVAANVKYHWVTDEVVLFSINGKDSVEGEVSDGIIVIFNATTSNKTVTLTNYGVSTGETWNVCIDGENAGIETLYSVTNGQVTVAPISAMVLVKGETTDTDSVYKENFKENMSLNKTSLNLKVGATETLSAKTNVSGTTITWTSDNDAVATVDASTGKVTAVTTGTATITATTSNGKNATCVVNVYEHNYSISSETLTLDLAKEESAVLTVTMDDTADATEPVVAWTSSNEDVATVSEEGVVTPVGVGKATISAAIENGPVLTCQVKVTATLKDIRISTEQLKLRVGDARKLNVIFDPIEAKRSVTWTSSDKAVATVGASTGKVTAVAPGMTTITVTAGEMSATCTIIVLPDCVAITNIHTKLSDIILPDGWDWLYGDIPMKSFVGVNEKEFQAVYTKEGSESVAIEVPVRIITVTKVNVTADASAVETGKKTGIYADIVATGGSIPEDMIKVEWNSVKPAIATVKADRHDKLAADMTGVKAGTAQVKASVTISDGVKSKTFVSAKKSMKVVDAEFAQVAFADIAQFTKQDSGVYVHPFTENKKVTVTIKSTASKLTLKSSDSKVVGVGKAKKNADGDFTAELTIKKAGYVELSAVANDAVKTTASLELYVKNAVPNVSTNKVELNNKSSKTASVYIYPNEDYEVESVSIDGTQFAVNRVGDTNEYAISMITAAEKKNHKQNLTIKVKDAATEAVSYPVPITISVVSKAPAITSKQTAKVNLFYTDEEANGSLTVTSAETITNVVLKDCDFEYDYATKEISVKDTANRAKLDKKGVLSVTFKDYAEPVEKNITIATENKAPKFTLSAKAATLYPSVGIETAQVNITDVTTGVGIAADELQVTFRKVKKQEVTAYTATKAENTVSFERTDSTFTAKVTADIEVKRANFSQPVKLTYAISVNKKDPAIVLDKKTMTLNQNATVAAYEKDIVNVSVKAAPNAGIKELWVEAANPKAQAEIGKSIVFETVAEDRMVTAKLADTTNLKNTTYKFNVYAKITDTCTVKTPLSVKVVSVAPEKTVTLKKSGSIDVLNRDTTAIVYTPKLTNVTGQIKDVTLTGSAAHLFKAELEDGKIKVTVKGSTKEEQNKVNLVTKYNYSIKMKLTLDNGESTCTIVTNEVKFKLSQSKPKVTALPKQAVMFNTVEGNTVPLTFSAANKDGTEVAIKEIELTNFTEAFSYEDGKLNLVNRGKVVKGKTYTLKFNICYEGCTDSEKVTTVTYKVKVN